MSTPPPRGPSEGGTRPPHAFEESYRSTPPWDIGRPQPPFALLLHDGAVSGRVLDAGCGTGEHVLMAAAAGLEATGVDVAPTAIARARAKAAERGVAARFVVGDALGLGELGEQFDTVLDSGLFHVFDDDERVRYVAALGAVVRPGGRLLLCCFSDRQPGDWGPRRVTQGEIRRCFADGWEVASIEATRFATNLDPPWAEAWLSVIIRTPVARTPVLGT